MGAELVLALDVGGSSVKSGLVAKGQQIVGDVCIDEIKSEASAPEILDRLAEIISRHLERAGDLYGIAFAFPGPFDYEQGISLLQGQKKYDALFGLDISAQLRKLLGLPTLQIRYRNDAEAAILGEALYGAGMPYSRLIGITLGTGLGSAFVAEGSIITEGDEIPPHGWLYACMFEDQRADDVFSTRGLIARLREHGLPAADIASAMQHTDDKALAEAFASFGTSLGKFLEPYTSNFRADVVLVTGGISESWQRFAPSLNRSLPVSALKGRLGSRAALLGAAALYF